MTDYNKLVNLVIEGADCRPSKSREIVDKMLVVMVRRLSNEECK